MTPVTRSASLSAHSGGTWASSSSAGESAHGLAGASGAAAASDGSAVRTLISAGVTGGGPEADHPSGSNRLGREKGTAPERRSLLR